MQRLVRLREETAMLAEDLGEMSKVWIERGKGRVGDRGGAEREGGTEER